MVNSQLITDNTKFSPVLQKTTLSNTCDTLTYRPLNFIGCDWLSMSFNGDVEKCINFKVVLLEKQTSLFQNSCNLIFEDKVIFTCVYNPRMKAIRKNCVIIKIENKWLYNSKLHFFLNLLFSEKFLTFSHVVRCDLFTDFQDVNIYKDPENMLKAFFNNKIAKSHRSKSQLNFKTGARTEFETLSFGRFSSRLTYKIYNKTKELQEGKSKKWIIDSWQKNNFDIEKTTWRCEFCIQNKNINFVDKTSGENWEIDIDVIYNKEKMQKTLTSFVSKYLEFKKVDNKINKKYWKNIDWTGKYNKDVIILKSEVESDETLSDRIYLKKMYINYINMMEKHNPLAEHYRILIDNFVDEKKLYTFYDKIRHNEISNVHENDLIYIEN